MIYFVTSVPAILLADTDLTGQIIGVGWSLLFDNRRKHINIYQDSNEFVLY